MEPKIDEYRAGVPVRQRVCAMMRGCAVPVRGAHYGWALAGMALYWGLMLWGTGEYWVTSPLLPDQTTPGTAVFVWREGVALHSELHSPLGWFYFWHCAAAARVAEWVLGDAFSIFDVQVTAHMLMFAFLLGLMAVFGKLLEVRYPLWLLGVLLVVLGANANPTALPQLHWARLYHNTIHWAFAYNTYMSSLFMVTVFALWQRWFGRREGVAETLLTAMVVFVMVLYKVNFGVGLAAVWGGRRLAAMTDMSRTAWNGLAVQAGWFVTGLAGLAAALTLGTSYDMVGYWEDLQAALYAKNVKEYRLGNLQGVPVVLILIVGSVWGTRRWLSEGEEGNRWCGWWRAVLWWCGLWGGVFLCASGASPVMQYFLYMLALVLALGAWLHGREILPWLRWAAMVPVLLVAVNAGVLVGKQAVVKMLGPGADARVLRTGNLAYAIPARLVVDMWVLPIAAADGWRETRDGDLTVRQIAEIAEIYAQWRTVVVTPAVSSMGVENHAPFFTPAPPPTVFSHWKFVYNVFHRDDARALQAELAASNIVLLPAVHADEILMYPSCWFLFESGEADAFFYAQRTGEWHVFVRRAALAAGYDAAAGAALMPMAELVAQPALATRCAEVLTLPPIMPAGAKTFLYPYLEAVYETIRRVNLFDLNADPSIESTMKGLQDKREAVFGRYNGKPNTSLH